MYLPGTAIDGTGDFQLIDDLACEFIIADVAGVDGRPAEGTGVHVEGVYVLPITQLLQAGLAEGVPEWKVEYPQKRRRGFR
jgi:hypothetical protein